MRRGKKTLIPARLAVPALLPRPGAKEPEAPCDASPAESSAAADPLQAPRPEIQAPSDSAFTWCPETSEPREPPPPLSVKPQSGASGQCARALTLEPAEMLDIFRSIPTQMDYKGQKLAEQIFQGIILVSAVIGFIYGYITEQFGWTVYIVMGGFALSCLLTLPPWPMYRRNPLKWLPVQESATDDKKPADRKVKRHPKN